MNSTNQRPPMPEKPDRPRTSKMLSDLLLKSGLIDSEGLSRAWELQERDHSSLGMALARLKLADEETVATTIARGLHLEYLGRETSTIAPELIGLLSSE